MMTDLGGQVGLLPNLVQLTHPHTISVRWPKSREWATTNFGVTVLICVLLSSRAKQPSPLTLTCAIFSIMYHWENRLGFKKGVWLGCLMHVMFLLKVWWVSLALFKGCMLPSLALSPSFCLKNKIAFFSVSYEQFLMKWLGLSQW